MSTTAIVSYDDTLNDHDALALARLLGDAGADLILAYVRHMTEERIDREQVEGSAADSLLERGARWLGDLDVERRVVVNRSTVEGLKDLARQEQAQLIVFGSDYRTAAGHVSPQSSTQKLLDGGPAAIAIAPPTTAPGMTTRSTRSACSPASTTTPRSTRRTASPPTSTLG
jgi:nucleotide-binding universal stress UspA family protein